MPQHTRSSSAGDPPFAALLASCAAAEAVSTPPEAPERGQASGTERTPRGGRDHSPRASSGDAATPDAA
ncbi:hypothetical protein QNO07_05265 [Streptomyces sp. 549]|uniref:hypothetical protein n=1 Tax=Streptomyces sp. 549 TaxID=3049076 RepID=UPI0024C296F6|nr:hypothetical protein [Streptomyces sp. 549]MDK1472844.1 hypothetical protein [Streptomyces sp. 549]